MVRIVERSLGIQKLLLLADHETPAARPRPATPEVDRSVK
jgi:hypothetical protein